MKGTAEESIRKVLPALWARQAELGLSDYALAKKAGIDGSQVSRIKSGVNIKFSFTKFLQLVGALDFRLYIVEPESEDEKGQLFVYTHYN